MGPRQHHGILGCRMLSGRQASEDFLGADGVAIEQRDQAHPVPRARLIWVFREYALEGNFRGAWILLRDATLAFCQVRDGVRIVRDRSRMYLVLSHHLFCRGISLLWGAVEGSELHRLSAF